MGIKSLNTLLSKHTNISDERVRLSKFSGLRFAVDTNLYLYKYLYGKNNHIDGIFFMINKLKKFNIECIFIFDGKPPVEKKDRIDMRKSNRNKIENKINYLRMSIDKENEDNEDIRKEIDNLEKKIMYVNTDVLNKTKKLFNLMAIPYIEADCEAEHYCSKLCKMNIVDGVISEDTDTIACGCKLVLRDFSNRDDSVLCYYINDILYDLNLNYHSFLDLCILLGNDYNSRIKGFHPDKIYELILKFSNIENILKNNMIKLPNFNYNNIRSIYSLKEITPNMNEISSQIFKKKFQLLETIRFMEENSSIDSKTFKHRLHLMYTSDEKPPKKLSLFGNSKQNLYQVEFEQFQSKYLT